MEDALIVALFLLPLMSVATESEPCCTLYAPWPQHIAPKIILCGPSSLFSYLSELLEIKSHRVIIFCFRDTLHRFRVYIQMLFNEWKGVCILAFIFVVCVADEPRPKSSQSNMVATVPMWLLSSWIWLRSMKICICNFNLLKVKN